MEDVSTMCGKRPNAETIAAIEEVEAMMRGNIPENVISLDELFKESRKKDNGAADGN